MTQRASLMIGIVAAFLAGIVITTLLMRPDSTGSLTGDVLGGEQESSAASGCVNHDQCPAGSVCKLGSCMAADTRFCSQDFMLAESLEGRFIRYTLCPSKCVRSGESAYCQ